MKKLFLVAVCALGVLTASAQRASSTSTSFFSTEKADQGVRFGIRAGLNFATMTGDFDESLDSRVGYHVGVIADIPLMQSLYVQTGLYFQSKGAKYEESYNGESLKETLNPMYLQIPVLASYRYNFSEATQLQVNFGPYFAFGVGGEYKVEYDDGSSLEEADTDVFGDNGLLKRFDCGLQVGAGITLGRHYYLGFNYEFGLTDMARDKDAEVTPKNSNWMISLGYTF